MKMPHPHLHHRCIHLILVSTLSKIQTLIDSFFSLDSPQWNHQQLLPSWCTINYYEYSQKVGGQFRASSSQIFVDGYTSPYKNFTNRFSLGLLENVKRHTGVESVRASIGRGR